MKKILGLCSLVVILTSSCVGDGSISESNNNYVSGSWVWLNRDDLGYVDNVAEISLLSQVNNNLYLVNQFNNIWRYNLLDNHWEQQLSPKNSQIIPTSLADDTSDGVFIGLDNGQMIHLSASGIWSDKYKAVENAAITAIQTIGTDELYMGNELSSVWHYANKSWYKKYENGYEANGSITDLVVEDKVSPHYIGVGNTEGEIWVYSIDLKQWIEVIRLALNNGFSYGDIGSEISSLQFCVSSGYNYGYIGNKAGHVWRIVIDPQNIIMPLRVFDNITDSVNFTGYTDNNVPITAMVVDKENNLYVGNQIGNVWLINFAKHGWVKLSTLESKFAGGNSPITALTINDKSPQHMEHTIIVANKAGYVAKYQWSAK